MFKRMDHVGIVVNDIDATIKTYQDQLGFKLLQRTEIPEQRVVAAFLDAGNSTVELISPTDTESGTAKYLANRGEGTHHIAYEVDDIVAVLAELKQQGLRLIDETPRRCPRFGGLHPSQGHQRHDDRNPAKGSPLGHTAA